MKNVNQEMSQNKERGIIPKRVLIINTFGIGDVLFATPLIANIRTQVPDAFIGFLANRRTEGLLRGLADLNKVYVYERDEFQEAYQRSWLGFMRQARQLFDAIKADHYDAVIDLSLNGTFGLLAWLSGIPARFGYNYRNRNRFLTAKIGLKGYEGRHVVDYYLDLLPLLGLNRSPAELQMALAEEDSSWAQEALKALKTTASVAVVVPGGGASWGPDAKYKRWPV